MSGASSVSAGAGAGAGSRAWPKHALAFLLLVALTCVLYARDVDLGWFDVDDRQYVIENPWIRAPTVENLGRIASEPFFGNYSPVHLYSYAIDWALGRGDPRVFHAASNVWAGICAGWVYLLALQLFRRTSAAWAAALLFLVHPAHVEAIAWISSRKDLVAAAFALPAAIAYLRYQGGGAARARWYVLSVMLFALAVAGKLSVVFLPLVLVLHDVLVARRRGIGILLDKIPFAIPIAWFAVRTVGAQPPTNVEVGLFDLARRLGSFLWLLTGFGDYVVFRPIRTEAPAPLAKLLWIALVLATAVAAPLFLWKRLPRIALVLYAWILLALAPSQVLGFVYPVSDRYLFVPSVALSLLVAWCALLLPSGDRARRLLAAGLVLLGAAWTARTWTLLGEWSDPRSVWYAASREVPDLNAYQYLGAHYQDRAAELERALAQSDPAPERVARLAASLGRAPDAALVRELRDLAWAELEHAAAIPTVRMEPSLYYRRGVLADLRGDFALAFREFDRARAEAANHPYDWIGHVLELQATYSMSLMAEKQGQLDLALRLMRKTKADQERFGGRWLPDVGVQVERLERLAGAEGGR